jgi:heme A synthase
MSDTIRFWFTIALGLLAVYVGYHILIGLIHGLISLVIPAALVLLVAYALSSLIKRKTLPGSKNPLP